MTVRWGIAGTGGIAGRFAEALRQTPDAELVAVGSRTDRRADAFGDEWDIPRRHGDYDDLAADDDVDVVYVATPQSRHADDACRYLDAGKHVLCEKPMAMTEAEVLRMTASAGLAERFLMEAIWSRFLPVLRDPLGAAAAGPDRRAPLRRGRLRLPHARRPRPPPLRPGPRRRSAARPRHLPPPAGLVGPGPARRRRPRPATSATPTSTRPSPPPCTTPAGGWPWSRRRSG